MATTRDFERAHALTRIEQGFTRPRTPLFTVGLVLSQLHALAGLAAGVAMILFAAGRYPEEAQRVAAYWPPVTEFLVNWSKWLGPVYAGLSGIQLLAGVGAWFGMRTSTWVLAIVGIPAFWLSGPVSLVINVTVILGAAQVLDQSRPYPADDR